MKPKKARIIHIRTKAIIDPVGSCPAISDEFKMAQLTQSIRSNGMVQPVTVTRGTFDVSYTLVAGRRRLEAAKRLGMQEIPAMVIPPDKALTAALFENMFREPASCFDIARRFDEIMKTENITDPVDLGILIGVNEQEIREKLSLLTLPEEKIELCRAAGIDQECANRILSMGKVEQDRLFFGLNTSQDIRERAWVLRSRLGIDSPQSRRQTIAVKDVRIFFNTIENAVDILKRAGIEATSERTNCDGYVEYLIRIPSVRPGAERRTAAVQGA